MAEGIRSYLEKLKPFADVETVEVKEEKGAPTEASLTKEGRRILKSSSSFFLFDEKGKKLTSLQFAALIRDRAQVDFVLGGPYGVSDEVRGAAQGKISFSAMTFTHDMARLIALEQIYRAMMINTGRGYHH